MTKTIYKYILLILGIIMVLLFVWFRFIRTRLPREIPFKLSILGFCLLLTTCSIFLYIIISLIRTNKSINPLAKQLVNTIYIPLETLDHYIKGLPYCNNTYKYGISFLANILGPLIIESKIYYYIFEIMPRVILLTAFYIDIFYFHKLVYIYKALLIGLIILIGKYVIYSFKYAKEHFIETFQYYINIGMDYEYASQVVELDDEEDDDIPPTMVVPLPIFIEFQTETYLMKDNYYDYEAFFNPRSDAYYIERNILIPRIFTYEEVTDRVRNILRISLILAYYELLQSDPDIKKLKILIYMNYFICWLYILLTSLPSLYNASFWELWIIFGIEDIQDPFSLMDCPSILNEIIKEIYADE